MAKKIVLITLVVMVCVYMQHTFMPRASAMGTVTTVTKETQGSQGLKFTLSAVRVNETVVLVRMEIPNKGKLKDLKRVNMSIGTGQGSPQLSADLCTTLGKNGSLDVSFSLSPELADKCSIELGPTILSQPMLSHYYAVELKGYVTDRK